MPLRFSAGLDMLGAVTRQSFRAVKTGDVFPIHGGSARQPIYRILRIHELLKDGKLPNCQDLSHDFEVSYKTVQRDIDFMRDQLQLPIEYDGTRHGFIYSRELNQLPAIAFKEGEARKVRILLDPHLSNGGAGRGISPARQSKTIIPSVRFVAKVKTMLGNVPMTFP